MKFSHWEPNLSWNALNFVTSVGSSRKSSLQFRCQKLDLSIFFGFRFLEPFEFSKFKPPLKRIIIGSIHMLQAKDFAQGIFAPTAETKKAGKASRRAEETPWPPLAAGRTACENWLSFIFT